MDVEKEFDELFGNNKGNNETGQERETQQELLEQKVTKEDIDFVN